MTDLAGNVATEGELQADDHSQETESYQLLLLAEFSIAKGVWSIQK